MAFTGNFACTSYKRELLEAQHDFRNHTFMLALYDDTAALNHATTDYTTDGEISHARYPAGGWPLTVIAPVEGNRRAWADFYDLGVGFSPPLDSVIQARGALIYNSTAGGGSGTTNAISVLDFGRDVFFQQGINIKFPTADWLNAIVLIK